MARHAKDMIRSIYDIDDGDRRRSSSDQLGTISEVSPARSRYAHRVGRRGGGTGWSPGTRRDRNAVSDGAKLTRRVKSGPSLTNAPTEAASNFHDSRGDQLVAFADIIVTTTPPL